MFDDQVGIVCIKGIINYSDVEQGRVEYFQLHGSGCFLQFLSIRNSGLG